MTKTKIGIDFGGGNLRIFDQKLGLVFNEPALIAVEKKGKKYVVIATGQKAQNILRKLDENIVVFAPISEGIIQSIEYASTLLKHALNDIYTTHAISKSLAILSVPSGINFEHKTNFLKTCSSVGFKDIKLIDTAISTFIGAETFDPQENVLVIDIGANKSDISIIKNFQIQKSSTLGLGGNSIKNAIIDMFWNENDFYINEETAKQIQEELCTLHKSDKRLLEITGIYTQNSEHISRKVSASEVYPIIKGFFDEVSLIAKTMLKEHNHTTKTETNNILLTGGLANIKGIEQYMTNIFPFANIVISNKDENPNFNGLIKIVSQ